VQKKDKYQLSSQMVLKFRIIISLLLFTSQVKALVGMDKKEKKLTLKRTVQKIRETL